jgi:hypothetical protein
MYIIEHQAFCYNMIWLLPPPLLPLSHQQVVFIRRRGPGGSRGAKSSDGEKARYSILKSPCI